MYVFNLYLGFGFQSVDNVFGWMEQVSSGGKSGGKEIIMVDPLEAKRLAAKQFQRIKAREKFKVIHCH